MSEQRTGRGGAREGAGRPRNIIKAAGNNGHVDPLAYLIEVMQSHEDDRMRIDAAKALLPFFHAKKGDVGKKEAQQQDAEQTQAASVFKASPPPLKAVR